MNLISILLLLWLPLISGDVYMHYPRGTNDRCDERSNDRRNDNRLFDSQNNAAGGYSWSPKEMEYFEGTELEIQWTSQHGCGNGQNTKANNLNLEHVSCNFVIQLGCEDFLGRDGSVQLDGYQLTDGTALPSKVGETCVNTRPLSSQCNNNTMDETCQNLNLDDPNAVNSFNSDACKCHPRKIQTYGLQESERFYQKCATRDRNKGLYTATQNLARNSAISTRQNPNGDRYGFECPEERDYYPYWHPTPYRDIAIVTSNTSRCAYYREQSGNVQPKGECLNPNDPNDPTFWQSNNQKACEERLPNAGVWTMQPPNNMSAPDCLLAEYLMDNHLGQIAPTVGDGDPHNAGKLNTYKWKIPYDLIPTGQNNLKCYLRLRYNISNSDVKWEYTSANNGALKQNPVVRAGDLNTEDPTSSLPLRLAINTAQFPRSFEDRSQVFIIKRRPENLKDATIWNWSVRGKRGNIAQVRNCVEYDFVPKLLSAKVGDWVHFQWTGSDYNDQNNDGQGRAGTDRSNVVPIASPDGNIILPLENVTMFSKEDLFSLAWIDQNATNCYNTTEMLTTKAAAGQDLKSCHFLNGAPSPYYSRLAQIMEPGVLNVISSRNNAFSNRSQRGVIIADKIISDQVVAGIASGAGIVGVGLIAAGVIWYMRRIRSNPAILSTKSGALFARLGSQNRI